MNLFGFTGYLKRFLSKSMIMKSNKHSLLWMALALLSSGTIFAQSKKELKSEIEQLKQQNQIMMLMMMQNQQNNIQKQTQQAASDSNAQTTISQEEAEPEIALSRVEKRMFEDTNKLRAVGEGQSREKQSAFDYAELAARSTMQRQIESSTKTGLERYRKETQMDNAEQFQANDEQLAQVVSKGIQSGCKVVDFAVFYNKDTKKYRCQVLVEYDKAGVIGMIESQDAIVMENRAKFEKHMQDVFDEMSMDKYGTTTAMQKQIAEDKMAQEQADRQADRDAQIRQQDADNALRIQESEQNYNLRKHEVEQKYNLQNHEVEQKYDLEKLKSDQNYNLKREKQAQEAATKILQQSTGKTLLNNRTEEE